MGENDVRTRACAFPPKGLPQDGLWGRRRCSMHSFQAAGSSGSAAFPPLSDTDVFKLRFFPAEMEDNCFTEDDPAGNAGSPEAGERTTKRRSPPQRRAGPLGKGRGQVGKTMEKRARNTARRGLLPGAGGGRLRIHEQFSGREAGKTGHPADSRHTAESITFPTGG